MADPGEQLAEVREALTAAREELGLLKAQQGAQLGTAAAAARGGGVRAMTAKQQTLGSLAGPEAAMAGRIDSRGATSAIDASQLAGIQFISTVFQANGQVKPEYAGFLTPAQEKLGVIMIELRRMRRVANAPDGHLTKEAYQLRVYEQQFGTTSLFEIASQLATMAAEFETKRTGIYQQLKGVLPEFTLA